jgi:tetratricopeptide (TPR) repeat protein
VDSETNLNILDLPSVFQSLSENQRDGSLRVSGVEGIKNIDFVQGNIRLVDNPEAAVPPLIEALRRFLHIENDLLQQVLEEYHQEQKPLGTLVLERQICSQEELRNTLNMYLTEEICDLFCWKNVQFEFLKEGLCPEIFSEAHYEFNIFIPPGPLMFEAARRADEMQRILEVLPSKLDIPKLLLAPQKITQGSALELLPFIDAYRDIEEIQEQSHLSRFNTLATLKDMFERKEIAFLELKEFQEVLRQATTSRDIWKGIRAYMRVEQMGGKTLSTCQWLAQAFEKAQDISGALHKYHELAEIQLQQEKFEDYHHTLEHICELDANDLATRERLISSLLKHQKYPEAIRSTIILVNAYKKTERYSLALESLSRVSEHASENQEILQLQGDLCVKNGDEIQALYAYETLAQVQLDHQHYDKAIETYRRMLKIDNENIDAHFKLANTLREKGDNTSAVAQFKSLAELLSSTGTLATSINWNFLINVYENIVSIQPQNYTAREWLADAYIRGKDKTKALRHLNAIIELVRNKDEQIYMQIATLKKIADLQPENFEARLTLADSYLATENSEAAIAEWQSLGVAAIVQEKYEIALDVFKKILKLNPFHLDAHQGIAKVYYQEKKIPESVQKYLDIAYLMKATSKYPEAITYFQKAYTLHNQEKRCLYELGEVYLRLGDLAKAIECYLQFSRESFALKNYGEVKLACHRILNIQEAHSLASNMLAKVEQITQS